MTLFLTEAQDQLYELGAWSAYNIELDFLELADRQNLPEPLIVRRLDGTLAFGITAPRQQREVWA